MFTTDDPIHQAGCLFGQFQTQGLLQTCSFKDCQSVRGADVAIQQDGTVGRPKPMLASFNQAPGLGVNHVPGISSAVASIEHSQGHDPAGQGSAKPPGQGHATTKAGCNSWNVIR